MPYQPRVTQGFHTNYAPALANFGAQIGAGIQEARRKREDSESAGAMAEILAPFLGYDPDELKPQLKKMPRADRNIFFQTAMQAQSQKLNERKFKYEIAQDKIQGLEDWLDTQRDIQQQDFENRLKTEAAAREERKTRLAEKNARDPSGTAKVLSDLQKARAAAEASGDERTLREVENLITKTTQYADMVEEYYDSEGNLIHRKATGSNARSASAQATAEKDAMKLDEVIVAGRMVQPYLNKNYFGGRGFAAEFVVDKTLQEAFPGLNLKNDDRLTGRTLMRRFLEAAKPMLAAEERFSNEDNERMAKVVGTVDALFNSDAAVSTVYENIMTALEVKAALNWVHNNGFVKPGETIYLTKDQIMGLQGPDGLAPQDVRTSLLLALHGNDY